MTFPNHSELWILVTVIISSNIVGALINPCLKTSDSLDMRENSRSKLFLTSLIENKKIEEARDKSMVIHPELRNTPSYSGYFTVNEKYDSNMFFWFFPSQQTPENAPVILWLEGNPNQSSMVGLFTENGPFSVTQNITLKPRRHSWHTVHNMLYIDNPVGTGFSFTNDTRGYVKTQNDVAKDLLGALTQFFQLFPEFQKNPFFVAGQSYAGKYIPTISNAIKDFNAKAEMKINLQGLAIGNGLVDPINQINYGDHLYQLGLVDLHGQKQLKDYEARMRRLIQDEKYLEAHQLRNTIFARDFNGGPSLLANLTGFEYFFNYLHPKSPYHFRYMLEWIQRPDVKRALHVGNALFDFSALAVNEHLKHDVMQSMATVVADLLNHYRILIYNGQLDIRVGYSLTENYLQKLNWTGAEKYKTARRKIWKVDDEIAGYTKTADNLSQVLVRNAGHMVPADQPKWALDLITRFTREKSFQL